ncbi:MAG: hypothetical protein HQL32_17325 [Planctomycetes bacterium]|nr:hypothetical protein [Planctomycetota bacterium]
MQKNKLIRRFSLALTCLLLVHSLYAGRRAEEDFWTSENGESLTSQTGLTAFPSESFVKAGLQGYANFGKAEDTFTAGLKISASFRDFIEYMQFRLDGFLGIEGTAEGLAEVDFVLMTTFQAKEAYRPLKLKR